MVNKIIESFKGELDEYEKQEFKEMKDLENAMYLLEERAHMLKIRQLISIELFEEYYYQIRKKYYEGRVKLQQKASRESIKDGTSCMSAWRERLAADNAKKADEQEKEHIKAKSEYKQA